MIDFFISFLFLLPTRFYCKNPYNQPKGKRYYLTGVTFSCTCLKAAIVKMGARSREITGHTVCTCGISGALQSALNTTTIDPVHIHSGTALPGSVRIPVKRRPARYTGSLRCSLISSTNPVQPDPSEKIRLMSSPCCRAGYHSERYF